MCAGGGWQIILLAPPPHDPNLKLTLSLLSLIDQSSQIPFISSQAETQTHRTTFLNFWSKTRLV